MKTKSFLLLMCCVVACGSSNEAGPASGPSPTADAAAPNDVDGGDAGTDPSDAAADAPSDAAKAGPVPVVFAVTGFASLVPFDPQTNTLGTAIVFKGVPSCANVQTLDIAIDSKRNAIVTTTQGAHVLDTNTGDCKVFGGSYNADALAFLPPGTAASTESLVGYFSPTKDYRRFAADGATTTSIASPPAFGEATDIVATSDGRTFITYQGELTQIDPATGAVIKKLGSLQMGTVTGLASWGTRIYGFTSEGNVYAVEVGASTLPAPKLVAQSQHTFSGAASAVPNAP